MKAVLISIQPKWCAKIASGEKTVEVRKTQPKLEAPFKCYIYCTKGAPYLNSKNGICYLEPRDILGGQGPGLYKRLSGHVIGEFVCNGIECFTTDYRRNEEQTERISRLSCVDMCDLMEYEANSPCLYGWHISELKIYDKPKQLSDFERPCKFLAEYEGEIYCDCLNCDDAGDSDYGITACDRKQRKPPQSWCYVEEIRI